MSTVNQGGQRIGWKYSTPLQAEYLNTFISGMATPGLVTRPNLNVQAGGESTTLTIDPYFSMFVNPIEDTNPNANKRLIKVSTTSSVQLQIDVNTVAIGFKFRFLPENNIPQSQWFGEFQTLTKVQARSDEYAEGGNGIIIATLMHWQDGATYYHFPSTNGADISDCLLKEEGWDPCRWVSLISPRRIGGVDGHLNKLEVRKHNMPFDGCINGSKGSVNFKGNPQLTQWSVPTSENIDPYGERGILISNKYTLFKFNTDGLSAPKGGQSFPIVETPGNILAYGDKSKMMGNETNFMNNFNIYPVEQEKINIWFEDATETLHII